MNHTDPEIKEIERRALILFAHYNPGFIEDTKKLREGIEERGREIARKEKEENRERI